MDYIFNLLNHYGLWLGLVFVALENIGLPLPVEFIYLYSQNLIDTHRASMTEMVIWFTLAHLSGSVIAYYVGYAGNSAVGRYFSNRPSLVRARARIEKWYLRYGSVTNFITRFVGYIRPWSSLVAGFAKENFWEFLGWTALGTLFFNIISLYFAKTILYLWNTFSSAKYVIVAGFLFFFLGIWFFFPQLSKRFKF